MYFLIDNFFVEHTHIVFITEFSMFMDAAKILRKLIPSTMRL